MTDAYDVILYGPTGVTGREVARYLHKRAPDRGLRWAVAGRDEDRIKQSLDLVGAEPADILIADSSDAASIDAMVERGTVIANLAGPYALYGQPVYEACARKGKHQLDLTGELDFVVDMMSKYQARAISTGAKIVPTCGYESLPFDLGSHHAAEVAHARSGSPVVSVDVAVTVRRGREAKGFDSVVSGGTFTSAMAYLERDSGFDTSDAYVLDPPESDAKGRISVRPRRFAPSGAWLMPLVPLPFLNPAVVHRGAALCRAEDEQIFAPTFRYSEGMVASALAPGPFAPVIATAAGVGFKAFSFVSDAPRPLRAMVSAIGRRFGPKAGEGPAPETLDAWSYKLEVRATCQDGASADVLVACDGQPGYKSTATMIGEAACMLAEVDSGVPNRAGFLTPATALGTHDLDRFAAASARFSLV